MPRCVSKHANRLTTCCCSMPENCGLMPWWASDTRVPRWVVRVRLRKFYATARPSSFSRRSPKLCAAGESPAALARLGRLHSPGLLEGLMIAFQIDLYDISAFCVLID